MPNITSSIGTFAAHARLLAITLASGTIIGFAALAPSTADAAPSLPGAGSPDLFGSVALRVAATPFDNQWSRVRGSTAEGGAWLALLAAGQAAGTRSAQMEAVNRAVNKRLTFRSDQELYGLRDHWATPREALKMGAGDCEDYAILKMAALRALGVPARDMYLVIVKDLAVRADHAVLAVRVDGRLMILDNRSDKVLAAEAVRDYRPAITLGATDAWSHGYRARPAIGALASNEHQSGDLIANPAASAP